MVIILIAPLPTVYIHEDTLRERERERERGGGGGNPKGA